MMVMTAAKDSSSWLQNLGALVLMVLVFALAYWGTRLLAQKPRLIGHSSQLKVIERLSLGRDRQLLLVQVGEKVYLAGVTPQHITLGEAVELPAFATVLDPLMKDDCPQAPPPGAATGQISTGFYQQASRWIAQGKDLIHASRVRTKHSSGFDPAASRPGRWHQPACPSDHPGPGTLDPDPDDRIHPYPDRSLVCPECPGSAADATEPDPDRPGPDPEFLFHGSVHHSDPDQRV